MHSFVSSIAANFRASRNLAFIGMAVAATVAMPALSHAHGFKAGDIEIGHPWSRATAPNAKVAAGYLTLKNNGASPDRLISVTGEISGRAEVHEMKVNDAGVMTMRPLTQGVELPAGETVTLEPGGYHIMFMELTQTPKEGERFKGSLTFEKAGTVEVEFAVDAMGSKPAGGNHEQMDHSVH